MGVRRQTPDSDDRRSYAPRGHTHTDPGTHTTADARCNPGTYTCAYAGYYAAQGADPPQTGDGFPLLAIVVVSLASATGIVLLTVKQKIALKETSDKEKADESSDR